MAADSASSVSSVGFQVVRRTPVSLTNLLFSSQDITSGEPDIWGTVVAARSRETPRTPPGYIRQSYRDGYDSDDNDSRAAPVTRHMLIPDPEHPRGQRALRQRHAITLSVHLACKIVDILATPDMIGWVATILQDFLFHVMSKTGWHLEF